jgi:hypothetical protein
MDASVSYIMTSEDCCAQCFFFFADGRKLRSTLGCAQQRHAHKTFHGNRSAVLHVNTMRGNT